MLYESMEMGQTSSTNKKSVGVCAMAKKADAPPMREMIKRLRGDLIDVVVFPEKTILEEPVENWPTVQALIAFYSDGFPLDKVQSYVELRKPVLFNDIARQKDLLSRTKVYELLKEAKIRTPQYAVVWRDDAHPKVKLVEEDDQITIDGQVIKKPFVEKPVSAEDHNIVVYYPASAGGGSRRLFRKKRDKSSEYSPNSKVRRTGSFIYEEFLPTNGVDVKVYAVGPDNACAEARKAPSLDGKVERNHANKEVRYPVQLRENEKRIARQIVTHFKQTVCGFDLLRSNRESYVCDVNGFSLAKASERFYEHTAAILRDMILSGTVTPYRKSLAPVERLVSTTTGAEMELRGVLAVIRHGDRTPKQKLKFVAEHERWTALYQKCNAKAEVKLKTPDQLEELLELVDHLLKDEPKVAMLADQQHIRHLEQLKAILTMPRTFAGINRKVQLKPVDGQANRFHLVAKCGGELTEAGVIQAEKLGERFRDLYPRTRDKLNAECGFLRLHNSYRHDLKIYASDEGRVRMTAAAFVRGLLAMDAELQAMLVHMVKSAGEDSLLDDKKDALVYKDTVKDKIRTFFQVDRDWGEQEKMELNPERSKYLEKAFERIGNPMHHCERLWRLMSKLCGKIEKKCKDPLSKNEKLYHDEAWSLVENRWEKLVKEFRLETDGRVVYEVTKIHEVYDCIRYDLEHNVKNFQFAEDEIDELYEKIKQVADVVMPQAYGLEKDEKLMIGQGTCKPLMKKLLGDLKAVLQEQKTENEDTTVLSQDDSTGVESPTRFVRTRFYFTSKSHLHSLMNVIRYGGLLEDEKGLNEALAREWECNYLAQIVIMLFEDKTKDATSDDRFHVELYFSPGIMPYMPIKNLSKCFTQATSPEVQDERLIAAVGPEEIAYPPLIATTVVGYGAKKPSLLTGLSKPPGDVSEITCCVPAVRKLATLSNRLTHRKLTQFLDRMIGEKPVYPK